MPTNQEWLNQLATESPDKLKAWFDAEHNDNLAAEKVVSGDAAHSNDGNAHLKASEDLSDGFTDSREKLEADVRSSLGFTTKDVFEWLDRQAAITKDECEESLASKNLGRLYEPRDNDTREALENDAILYCDHFLCTHQRFDEAKLIALLDRQAAITERECLVQSVQGADAILTAENAELQEQVDELREAFDEVCKSANVPTDWKPIFSAGAVTGTIEGAQKLVKELTAERDNLAADLLTCNREREQLRKHLGIALDHAHDICSLVDIDGNVLDVGD